MNSMKIWQLLPLILPAYLYGVCTGVEFVPCFPAIKGQACNMTCKIPDFTKGIEFKCNGSSRGLCSFLLCPNMIKEVDKLLLPITSISYTTDKCDWNCVHGGTTSADSNLVIFSGITHPVISSNTDADGVILTATAHCVYPYNTSIVVQYSEQKNRQYLPLTSQETDRQWSHVPGNCTSDLEKKITATFKVPMNHEELLGKTVYFKFGFSQYDSDITVYTVDASGPFTFDDCKLEIRLFGSLPVSLFVLITSIVIIILLILKKEPFFKHFGELTKKKVFIIVAIIVVAIIIGLCLGLLIEGICDKKPLALGLSILFAILLAVALIFILFKYHKKSESKKGSSRNK